jgi:hypothetical protein
MSRRLISRAKQDPIEAIAVDGVIFRPVSAGTGKRPSTGGLSKDPGHTCQGSNWWNGCMSERAMFNLLGMNNDECQMNN